MQLKNALVLLVGFSLFTVMLNASGLFAVDLASQDIQTLDESDVTELTNTPSTTSEPNVIGSIVTGITGFAFSMFTSLFSFVFSVIGVEPILLAYGVPQYMATLLEGMLSLITIIALILLLANRSDKGVS